MRVFSTYFLLTALLMFIFSCKSSTETTEQVKVENVNTTNEPPKVQAPEMGDQKEELTAEVRAEGFYVYLNDPDKSGTNIRKEPKGEIITTIKEGDNGYSMKVVEAEKGWFKISGNIIPVEGEEIQLPKEGAWIHGSVIEVGTRNYGMDQVLDFMKEAGGNEVAFSVRKEIYVRPTDMKENWVKIKYEGKEGWVENSMLCGNPVTNCN